MGFSTHSYGETGYLGQQVGGCNQGVAVAVAVRAEGGICGYWREWES